jgi:hypothetical protein
VFEEILPRFEDAENRATSAAQRYWELAMEAGVTDEEAGSDAFSCGWDEFNSLCGIRQMLLNLFAVCLFHTLEQQLALACNAHDHPSRKPVRAGLKEVANWLIGHRGLDISGLREWAQIDDLRRVANAVKHATGPAAARLAADRPDLFEYPGESAVG